MSVKITDLTALTTTVSHLTRELYKVSDLLTSGHALTHSKGYTNMYREDPADARPDEETFRVNIMPDGTVSVLCFSLPTVDSNCEGHYDRVDALPNWVQERLAILMMTDHRIKPTPHIADIGRRISEGIFWVYSPRATSEEESRA